MKLASYGGSYNYSSKGTSVLCYSVLFFFLFFFFFIILFFFLAGFFLIVLGLF